jgi:hypothetical protein
VVKVRENCLQIVLHVAEVVEVVDVVDVEVG